MNYRILLILMLASFGIDISAQRNCASMDVLQQELLVNPSMQQEMDAIERQTQDFISKHARDKGSRAIVTIPVVFHVVYRTTAENVSDEQLISQLNVLNEDFRFMNADKSLIPDAFKTIASDIEIDFCLAKQTPSGTATTGIERKLTSKTSWGTTGSVKYSNKGGLNAWDRSKYLNIWVCNIGGGILGYATFPGSNPDVDGVVIGYRYIGTIGTATPPFDKGRTATHEVGHWLALRHIWGDASCGSDLVDDTPVHKTANYACPTHPKVTTCTGGHDEMFMNYMDYVDDACMQMFSAGQKLRMRAVLEAGGARASITSSPGCLPPGPGTCQSPASPAVTNISSSSALTSWTAVSGASSYSVQFRQTGNATWTTINTATTSTNLTGLLSATTYEWQVAAVCAGGNSVFAAGTSFVTLATGTICTDNYEGTSGTANNKKTNATALLPGTPITATISSATDVDWYKFNNTSTQRNVMVTMADLPENYNMTLYRGNTQVGISQNTGLNTETITYVNTQTPTTFYVYVYPAGSAFNNSVCYSLVAQISAAGFRVGQGGDNGELEEAEILTTDDFLVFPNPATSELLIRMPLGEQKSGRVRLFETTGREVYMGEFSGDEAVQTATLDVSSMRAGVYLVHFTNGEQVFIRKIVIARD